MEKVFFTVGYSMTRVTCPAEKKHVNAIIRKISTVIYEQWMRRKGQRPRIRQMFINLYRDAQFPSGLLEKVLPKLSPDEYVVVDQRQKPSRDPRLVFDPTLFDKARWYQKEALAAIKEHKRLIVKEPTGCHSPGTKVIMFDGRFRNVEDVRVGDKLLGPDGNARTVLNLFQGYDDLLEVIPTKGDCFDINSSHVLTLVSNSGSDKDEIIDIPYQDWLLKSKTYKHTHKLIRADCLEFGGAEKKELPLEPYLLGVLLGDGSIIKGINIETPESELITYIRDIAKKYDLSVRVTNSKGSKSSNYHLGGRGEKNAILDGVKQLQLLGKKSGEKFIPFQYLTASIADRMQLLAGLLDTDGYASDGGYDYITKSDQLSKDILFLCRSLGLAAYSKKCIKGYGDKFRAWYNRIYISGDCTNIPVKVSRRKAISRKINKDWRRVGFKIHHYAYGQYFGFQLSGDGRYLLSDFTITHNSGKTMLAACAINAAGVKTLYIVPTIELLHQTAREFAGIFGRQNIGVIGDGMWAAHPAIVVATVQSLWSRYEDNVFFNTAFDGIGMLILDECFYKYTRVHTDCGYKNIWTISNGDLVYTDLGYKPVDAVYKNMVELSRIVRVFLESGDMFFCSVDHPFFTMGGLCSAGDLYGKDLIFKQVVCNENIFSNLFNLWSGFLRKNKHGKVLLPSMQASKCNFEKKVFAGDAADKFIPAERYFGTHETYESNVEPEIRRKNGSNKRTSGILTFHSTKSWRKWTIYKTASAVISSIKGVVSAIRVGNRICNQFRAPEIRLSNSVFGRYRECTEKVSNRSRRAIPLWKKKIVGSKENGTIKSTRVAGVAVYKQGYNDKLFEGVIGDSERREGYVIFYDLNVRDAHHYYIGAGYKVHNCHHVNVGDAFENTWFKIANRIPAYWRIGMSATPGEPNEKNRQLLEAATGLLRHETKTMDLVDQGFLVVPKPKFYTCKHERRYKSWVVAKGTGLSANEARNKMIATLALSAALKNKKVLIIVDRVETHGQVLYELIGSNRSMFVYGSIDSGSRLKAKREFESGRIPILIGTIYGEGVNMPKMDVVINAAGGKSSRVAIQRMGRVLRISEGKSEGVLIDFMDEDRGVLLEHSLARFQTYQDEGYEPEVLEYAE